MMCTRRRAALLPPLRTCAADRRDTDAIRERLGPLVTAAGAPGSRQSPKGLAGPRSNKLAFGSQTLRVTQIMPEPGALRAKSQRCAQRRQRRTHPRPHSARCGENAAPPHSPQDGSPPAQRRMHGMHAARRRPRPVRRRTGPPKHSPRGAAARDYCVISNARGHSPRGGRLQSTRLARGPGPEFAHPS